MPQMGLFGYTMAGGGVAMIGGWEALVSSSDLINSSQRSPSQLSSPSPLPPEPAPPPTKNTTQVSSSIITLFATTLLSFFFILNSLISLLDSLSSKDRIGLVVQLEIFSISLLFFIHSLLGLFSHLKIGLLLPTSLLDLLCLYAFIEEFLFFYLQRKDPSGIENRYFDMILVPIGVCVFSTILQLKSPHLSPYTRIARGVGLFLQGTWLIQMGFSFYSNLIAHGCSLHQKSRGNYTIKCKGHPEYHRGRAVATLQFNCHLALVVAVIVGVFAVVCRKQGIRRRRGSMQYRPIGPDMQRIMMMNSHQSEFSLDSDDEDDGGIKEDKAIAMVPNVEVNGHH